MTTRVLVSPIAYNTNLVKTEDAPKSFADLLDPKWAGKMVKAHPAYSGTIMNATFQIARDLGWDYLEKLAKQSVMQVQSATDHAEEDRARRARRHGRRRRLSGHPRQGGRPAGRDRSIRPRARRSPPARAPCSRPRPIPTPRGCSRTGCTAREGQQILVDCARQYSPHKQTVEKPGVRKLADIKLMKEDPEGVEKGAEEIKKRYAQIFKV